MQVASVPAVRQRDPRPVNPRVVCAGCPDRDCGSASSSTCSNRCAQGVTLIVGRTRKILRRFVQRPASRRYWNGSCRTPPAARAVGPLENNVCRACRHCPQVDFDLPWGYVMLMRPRTWSNEHHRRTGKQSGGRTDSRRTDLVRISVEPRAGSASGVYAVQRY